MERADVLVLNAGSTSIKLARFAHAAGGGLPVRTLSGQLDGLGRPGATLTLERPGQPARTRTASGRGGAAPVLLDALAAESALDDLAAVGHRIVHGGPQLSEPCALDRTRLAELKRIVPFDPEHLPLAIELVEALARARPELPQVACFDTAFHRDLPRVAQLLAIPRRYFEAGVRRYGFHGLSCSYLMEALGRAAGPEAMKGRVIIAHLGGGSSLTAAYAEKSVDTTMALTPAAGVPMATRSGDVDPGLLGYLLRTEGLRPDQLEHLLHHESGLYGLAQSADVRELLAREASDSHAADALALYCQEVKKRIGALAAVLGGLDTLIFSGGIGVHAPALRARMTLGLEFLGLVLDPAKNQTNAPLISAPQSRVAVRVIPTDEEVVIARATWAWLAAQKEPSS
ncbi:MAG TPA: acetate/propionate family kinase [Polyangia bacterium]|nr:acetate/propionate family kinase [Polyangia bacterium]